MTRSHQASQARRAATSVLATVCACVVRERYAAWLTQREHDVRTPEPQITVTWVRASLVQADCIGGVAIPAAFKDAAHDTQYDMVRGGLEASVRAGTLERASGVGAHRGRGGFRGRVTVYVPADIAARYVLGQCRECLALFKHETCCSQHADSGRFDVDD